MRPRAALLLAALAVALGGCGSEAPSDREMRDAFTARRQTFETLRTELCKLRYDLTISRDPSWTQPQIHVAEQKRFLDLLDEIGARSVKYVHGCQFWIEIWRSGVGREASYKKYRYGPPLYRILEVKEPPDKDLNTYLKSRVAIASFEKNLDGDWWIELDHWQ